MRDAAVIELIGTLREGQNAIMRELERLAAAQAPDRDILLCLLDASRTFGDCADALTRELKTRRAGWTVIEAGALLVLFREAESRIAEVLALGRR